MRKLIYSMGVSLDGFIAGPDGEIDWSAPDEELPGARLLDFEFEDMEDASLAALSADPERVLEAGENGATSFFERMQRDHPDELRAGLARLREDIAAGRAPRRAGTATVLSWTKR